jgi:hypothetical protein
VSQLLSKIVAGGLSAAVILIWWPRFFPVDSVEAWLARGVIWTLGFELLVFALVPLEQSLWRSRAAQRVRSRGAAARARVTGNNPSAGRRLRGALACTAVAVPVALLASAPAPPADEAVAAKPVKHVTQIKRVVRVERPDAGLTDGPAPVASGPAPGAPATVASGGKSAAPQRSSAPATHRRSKPTADRGGDAQRQPPAKPDARAEPQADADTRSPAPATPSQPQPEADASGTALHRFAG